MNEIPGKLGKYEILRELGRGAMGVVYEAFDPVLERTVALKTIRRDQLEGAEAQDVITRFQREAKAAGRLNHPNIVSVYDFGDDAGTTYIAMEFVHGRELRSFFEKDERFPIIEAARIMEQLLDALEYSHNFGVVHRDIKPANIIIQPTGQVKVADFGIARIESSQYTQAGTVLGTPAYMSPEQFMGQTVDRRSDIFSAGVVLYQFLTGERPFSGAATTIMHKVLSVDPPPPSALNVQVPRLFDAVMGKAIAKRPEDRYQTAREFAVAINQAAAGTSAGADADSTVIRGSGDATVVHAVEPTVPTLKIPTPAPAAAVSPAPAAAPATASAVEPPPPPKKSKMPMMAGIAGAAVAAIAVVVYMAMPHAKPDGAGAASAVAANAGSAITPAVNAEPGTMLISAVGLADPNDQKYQGDKSLLAADLRSDSKRQLVEKAIALYIDPASLSKNYEILRDKVLANSSNYIANIVQEGEPQLGKDGLMYVTTQASVKVREVQKSLNQMSRDERVDFIRNNGDPKISVSIAVRDEDANAPPQNSQVAENLIKERIKSFGFRLWADNPQTPTAPGKGADFAVVGEARLKKLSAKLAASGITIEKYLLTSWTVKCIDKETGEEIYFNNQLPTNIGSWATPEQALAAIGGKIAEEFSRDFFMQHFNNSGQAVTLKLQGIPDQTAEAAIAHELTGLQRVTDIKRRSAMVYDLELAGGTGPLNDLVAASVLKPLNAKLGRTCFNLGATAGQEVTVTLDAACADASVISRLYTNLPASLYVAPAARQSSVLKSPDLIKKLTI